MTKNKLPLVSIVIPLYGSLPYYKKCLDSVLKTRYPFIEVLLIDDLSVDGAPELINKQYKDKRLKLVRLKKKGYVSGARTEGAKLARGKYVAFLDHDVEVDKNWIAEHIKILETDDNIGATQGKILDFRKRKYLQTVAILLIKQLGWVIGYGLGQKDTGKFDNKKYSLAGATNVVYRKSVFKKIGYFDQMFRFNVDDLDLAMRTWIAGYKTLTVPKAIIYHWTVKDWKRRGQSVERLFWENEFVKIPIVLLKNYQTKYLCFYFPMALFFLLARGIYRFFKGNYYPIYAYFRMLGWLIINSSTVLKKRKHIQDKVRKIDDLSWFNKVAYSLNIFEVLDKVVFPLRRRIKINLEK
jgi:GT2 family glycosyltransferase